MLPNFYDMMDKESLAQIHAAALDVLESTGLRITHPLALEKLAGAGATVDRTHHKVGLTPDMVARAVAGTPSRFLCAGRSPEFDFSIGGTPSPSPVFRTVGGAITHCDLTTRQTRPITLADCGEFARLADSLPHINTYSSLTPTDIAPETYDIETLKAGFENGRKHMWSLTTDSKNLKYQLEMMVAVAGGAEQLRQRPVCSGIVCLIEPLYFPDDEIERLLQYGEYNLPVRVPLVPIVGANAPYTLPGTLVQTHAEALGALVLLQTLCPGIATWYYPLLQTMDMRTGTTCYLNPETILAMSALLQLARHFNIPSSASSLVSSTCREDQILFERGTGLSMTALSGGSEIGGIGGLENGLMASPQAFVMDNEFIAFHQRMWQGFEITPDTLALAAVKRVGHSGRYLTDTHTLDHLRSEARFSPELLDWRPRRQWIEDPQTFVARAESKRRQIMQTHEVPPLAREVAGELDRIAAAAQKALLTAR